MAFSKGASGNPLGRPVGIKDRRAALRDALEGRGKELLEKAVEKALEGDTAILNTLLSKVIPSLKPESVPVGLFVDAGRPSAQASALVNAALNGEISPTAASELLQALAHAARISATDEFLERIERLEKKNSCIIL